MSALEALSWGIPTYITKECNLEEFLSNGSAFEINNDTKFLEYILEDWAKKIILKSPELKMIGKKGRELVEKNYSRIVVGKKLKNLYDSIY